MAEKLEIFKNVLLKNGFAYVKSDSVSQEEFNHTEYFQERFIPLAYTSDSLVRRSFYEMETSVEIRTYYKKKPERKKS